MVGVADRMTASPTSPLRRQQPALPRYGVLMNQLDLHEMIRESLDAKKFQDEHWQGSFQQYMELLEENPLVVRTAHQRLYDMVLSHGVV